MKKSHKEWQTSVKKAQTNKKSNKKLQTSVKKTQICEKKCDKLVLKSDKQVKKRWKNVAN